MNLLLFNYIAGQIISMVAVGLVIAIVIGFIAYRYKLQEKQNKEDKLIRTAAPNWMVGVFSFVLVFSALFSMLVIYTIFNSNQVGIEIYFMLGILLFLIIASLILIGQALLTYVAFDKKNIVIYRLFKQNLRLKYKDIGHFVYSKEAGIGIYDKNNVKLFSADGFHKNLPELVENLIQNRVQRINK